MEDGVWRTVAGRRIFIKEGQSLKDAMKNSGKFKESEEIFKPLDEKDIEELQKNSDEVFEKLTDEEKKGFRAIYKSRFQSNK